MSAVFLLFFLNIYTYIYKIDLSNYKNYLHLLEIKSGPDQVPVMALFTKIVNRSITLLFLQDVPSWMSEYSSSVSATAVSLTYVSL